jgi:ribosome-binding factor A
MSSRRTLKAAQAIRQVIGMAILAELKDPRVAHVTVTAVEVAPDMRQAKVFVSIMGDETRQKLALSGLRSAAGFLQAKVADRIETRYTPRLEFVLDPGVKKSIAIAEILNRVLPRDEPAGSGIAAPFRDDAARDDGDADEVDDLADEAFEDDDPDDDAAENESEAEELRDDRAEASEPVDPNPIDEPPEPPRR